MAFTNQARGRGASPTVALQHGIATALTQPIGPSAKRSSSPSQSRAPRRLGGRRGMSAFGALGLDLSTVTASAGATNVSTPIEGSCTTDGQFIYQGGTWVRRSSSSVCTSNYIGAVDVRSHAGDQGEGGTTVVTTPTPTGPGDGKGPYLVINNVPKDDASGSATQILQVGPFGIPLGASAYTIHWPRNAPAEWLQWASFITQELAHDCSNCVVTSMEDATAGHPMGVLRDFFGDLVPPQVNKDLVTIAAPTINTNYSTTQMVVDLHLPDQPIALVTRPDTGEDWGLFLLIQPHDPSYPWDSTTNPYELSIVWKKNPQGVWDWIKKIVGAIVDIVKDIACTALPGMAKTPNAYAQGAAATLAVTGACVQTCPPGMVWNPAINSCQMLPSTTDTLLPWLLLGGLGILGVYFATR
jgi:hypothetical protein